MIVKVCFFDYFLIFLLGICQYNYRWRIKPCFDEVRLPFEFQSSLAYVGE